MDELEILGALAGAPMEVLRALRARVSPGLGKGRVIREGPALVPLPFRDSRRGTLFYLGEALVYEVWLRFPDKGVEGYGATLGPDRERARALAILDAALALGLEREALERAARDALKAREEEDRRLSSCVESTRLEVETL